MSARRPGITRDLSYEEAAAAAGVDPDLGKIFDEHTKPATGEERKTLLGRRVTLVITRESTTEAPMTDTVVPRQPSVVDLQRGAEAGTDFERFMQDHDLLLGI